MMVPEVMKFSSGTVILLSDNLSPFSISQEPPNNVYSLITRNISATPQAWATQPLG
jgi:hypothetical protein